MRDDPVIGEPNMLSARAHGRAVPSDPLALMAPAEGSASRMFVDATLVLRHGRQSAVGIVRVEHYVYEFIIREAPPSAGLDFVVWDQTHLIYRAITEHERLTLASIIFLTDEPDIPPPEPEVEAKEESPDVSQPVLEPDHTPTLAPITPEARKPQWVELLTHLRAFADTSPADRDAALAAIAIRYLPVLPEHNTVRRFIVRAVRVSILLSVRAAHSLLAALARPFRTVEEPPPPIEPEILVAPAPPPEPPPPPPAPAPPANPFRAGDVLVSLANIWDYIDYPYLASLKSDHGVRFICGLYDICGLELPYVTPGPTDIYHRHWVEIGHLAERLICISHFSADSYRKLIAEPNNINVPIDVAGLPSFLRHRAAEIGELAVLDLIDRDFIAFCSTIEIRKNHILLLNLWDELRQILPEGRLPILVLVGKWGWYADNVRMIAERNFRLRQHLQILNDITDPELIWIYRHARFTVFPALSEGFGLAAAESLSFGTPVVISHCPALVEATEGLMPALHPHDFIGWLREIERLILDDAALAELRAKAAEFRGPPFHAFAQLVLDAARGTSLHHNSPVATCSSDLTS